MFDSLGPLMDISNWGSCYNKITLVKIKNALIEPFVEDVRLCDSDVFPIKSDSTVGKPKILESTIC